MKRQALLLLVAACATTPEFRLRAEGDSLYHNCVSIYGKQHRHDCAVETAHWCLDQGLEASCFVDSTRR